MPNDEGIQVVEFEEPETPKRRKVARRGKSKTVTVRKTEWTKARERDLVKALKGRKRSGLSVAQIAKKQFGVSPGAIYQKAFSLKISVANGKPT